MHKLLIILMSYLPTRLPVGMDEFQSWAKDILDIVGPIADEKSLKFTLASMIMHLSPLKDKYGTLPGYVPKQHFVQGLIKACANQVANQVVYDIKTEQAEAQKKAAEELAAKQKQDAADTVTLVSVPDGSPEPVQD